MDTVMRLSNTVESPGGSGVFRCATYDSTGEFVIGGHSGSSVTLWSLNTNSMLATYKGHNQDCLCVHSSQDNRFIVSGSADSSLICWDVSTGKILRRLCEHKSKVQGVRYVGISGLISVSMDTTCCIWDIRKPKALCQVLKDAKDSLTSVDTEPDGGIFVASCLDGKVYCYDTRNSKLLIDCVHC